MIYRLPLILKNILSIELDYQTNILEFDLNQLFSCQNKILDDLKVILLILYVIHNHNMYIRLYL